MNEIEYGDLALLCLHVETFSHKANLRWKGRPLISWEFSTISDFMEARARIKHAVLMDRTGNGNPERQVGDNAVEYDCCGVVFRLVCKQTTMTRDGPFGAAEIKSGGNR